MKITRINLDVKVTDKGTCVYIYMYAHACVCNFFFEVGAVLFNATALQISFQFHYCHLSFWVPMR